ncbi:terminase [Micromonospora sp. CA-246542]|uniref:terminase n=1 Tax=Micromonospora sp. CA-246542 TaxID=3239959 RepID=UPI003D93A5DC
MGELWPDGKPRFLIVLILVARQNGKTHFMRVLTLYWMFVEAVPLVFGTHADRGKAKDSWKEVIEMAERIPLLADELPTRHIVKQNGEEEFFNVHGSKYKFHAANSKCALGYTVHRAIIDELREHKNSDAWEAIIPTTDAAATTEWGAQAVAITNEGDESAEVLHGQTEAAEDFINTGNGDPRLGMFSWSSPPGSDPTDLEALAYANPSLGHRLSVDALHGKAIVAKRSGGERLTKFRIQRMCQRVAVLNPGIDPECWKLAGTTQPINLADHRDRLALCLDVALDGSHATLVAAATVDGITHVEVVDVYYGFQWSKRLERELPGWVAKLKPRQFGWYEKGPAAAIWATLSAKNGNRQWPPRRCEVIGLDALRPAVCMGLNQAVINGEVQHPDDALLNSHVSATQKSPVSMDGTWWFMRRGASPIDASYALAGAVHMARTMPGPRPPVVALV